MASRSTRSKQRAEEAANASPAKSTRSGGRSVSPAAVLNFDLRSSSPAGLRAASPVTSSKGRGRGRGRGAATSSSPTKATGSTAQPVVRAVAKRGRARGRGRGRPKKSTSDTSLQPEVLDDGDNENLVEDKPAEDNISEPDSPDDVLAAIPSNSDSVCEQNDDDVSVKVLESADEHAQEVTANETDEIEGNFTDDQWVDTNLNLTEGNLDLSVESLKQLESVLTSEEGLKLLTEQPDTVEAISDIGLGGHVIEENMGVDSEIISDNVEKDVEEHVAVQKTTSEQEQTAPRRKSERVTDLERRALAEKIRQENIRQEKEMMEKMKSESKPVDETTTDDEHGDADATHSKTAHSKRSALKTESRSSDRKPVKPLPSAIKKELKPSPKSSKKSMTPSTDDKAAKQALKPRKSSLKKSRAPDKTEDAESAGKTTPDSGGWMPGKIKVIDRKSGSMETDDRMKRKSQELKRRLSSAAEDLFKPDEPIENPAKRSRHEKAKVALSKDEISGGDTTSSSDEEDADDEEWKEEDDPDRLWCVCRKPHDNRFMICCDRCEEWYHGDCVGISRRRGTQMETDNEEYICSQCKEKELVEQLGGEEKLAESTVPLVTSSTIEVSPVEDTSTSVEITSTTTPTKTSVEMNAEGKPMIKLQGEIRKKKGNTAGTEKRKQFVFQTRTPRQHCIGSGCDNWAEDYKIYCSLNCIRKHANESLEIISREKSKLMGAKHDAVKTIPDIVVMERHTGRLVTGAHAPIPDNLIPWLTKHPSFEVLRPGQQTGHVSSNSSSYGKQKSKLLTSGSEEKPHKRSGSAKEDESAQVPKKPTGPDPSTIRSTVKKSLMDALKERQKEIPDDKTSEEEIKSIAVSIEHELFKYNGDTNNKYKNRFRSLIFNVKDPKNKGLFRKILRKKLKPTKLVRMTPDELASKELHQWREKEMQSEIEKIKADEERKASIKAKLVKITHKGEIEVEQDNFIDMETKLEEAEKDYEINRINVDSHPDTKSSRDDASGQSVDILSSIMSSTDTTSQHDAHLFDSNCKICIGKQAAPTGAELERKSSKKVKVAHHVRKSAPTIVRESSKEEIDKTVRTELQDLEKEIKVFEAEDKIIAEKLEKRRRSHLESKKRMKDDQSPKQEPSSTVRSPLTPPLPDLPSPTPVVRKRGSTPSAWKGFIDAPDISCKFFTTAHCVHGNSESLKMDLPDSLQIVGRIHPSQVWEYIGQLKHTLTREVILVRFSAVNDEEKIGYKVYFKYLSEKKRFGVVGNGSSDIKDMYIIPLPSHESLPAALKPYRHKVLADDNRPSMLVGLVVRAKSKKSTSLDLPYGKRKKSSDDEPYEPPGIDEIIPAEPETPSPMTTPTATEPYDTTSVEEYDPAQPLVSLSAPGSQDSHEDMHVDGSEMYDPIVSAYSLADPKTLNAEDAPGADPYSPGQDDMDDSEDSYDPTTAPLVKFSPQNAVMPSNTLPPPPAEDEPYDPMAPLHRFSPPPPAEPYKPAMASPPPPEEPYDPAAALARVSPPPPEELYDPAMPLSSLPSVMAEPAKASSSSTSNSSTKGTELTAQQLALQQLTEQVEQQRRQLEEHKARLAQQFQLTPSRSSSSTSTVDDATRQHASIPINEMDFLNSSSSQRVPAASSGSSTLLPDRDHSPGSNSSNNRPKISFSLSVGRSVPHSSRQLAEEDASPHRPYLPPASQSPQNKPPLLAPPPPPVTMPMSSNLSSTTSPNSMLADLRVPGGVGPRVPGGIDPRVSGGVDPRGSGSVDPRVPGGVDRRVREGPERLPFAPAGPNNRDEDYRQRDLRRDYDERRWQGQDRYDDDRPHWRGPPPRGGDYPQQMSRDVDYRYRNRRDDYSGEDRYHRQY